MNQPQKIGLFFGSFNPIHHGHLIIANYMLQYTAINKLWFVVSPQNPLKPKNTLLADYHRLELVRLAINDHPDYQVCDIEFKLPKPSYTIQTLAYLTEKYPTKNFYLIIGSDNLQTFHKWKNFESILNNYYLLVYPRADYDGGNLKNHEHVIFTNAPRIEISSTFIRQGIKEKKDLSFFVPEKSYQYIKEMHFYEK
jgi:nicotinate-nucleotide adenylyltransferase